DEMRDRILRTPRFHVQVDQGTQHLLALLAARQQRAKLPLRVAPAAAHLELARVLEFLVEIRPCHHGVGPAQRSGRTGTTSNATVVLGRSESNGTVPCHMYEGNSTSRPTAGRTWRRALPCSPRSMSGSPNLRPPPAASPCSTSGGTST